MRSSARHRKIPPLPFPDVADPVKNRKRWCDVLAQVAPLAEARGLILTVENFPGAASAFVTAALVGEGDVPSAAVFKTLKELDYKGYINIEYESMKYKADEAIRRALEFLRNI